MSIYELKNEKLAVTVDSFGAELKSIKANVSGQEYMWDARPEYWKRTSPILFPLVGGLKNKEFKYKGKKYPMSQHGFARDMEFILVSQTNDTLWFEIQADEETKKKYPFDFTLELGYRLIENTVEVLWKVINRNASALYFSIGGHPGFMCPLHDGEKQTDYFLRLDSDKEIICTKISAEGLATSTDKILPLQEGIIEITETLFDEDALVIQNNQAHKVSFLTPDKVPYLSVAFDAPLFGIWSPPKLNAPFICIEPWYGRCDHEDFSGSLEERDWANCLLEGESFSASYSITIENLP